MAGMRISRFTFNASARIFPLTEAKHTGDTDMAIETPFQRGHDDGMNGAAQSECPFLRGSLDAAEWLDGWAAGDPTAP